MMGPPGHPTVLDMATLVKGTAFQRELRVSETQLLVLNNGFISSNFFLFLFWTPYLCLVLKTLKILSFSVGGETHKTVNMLMSI